MKFDKNFYDQLQLNGIYVIDLEGTNQGIEDKLYQDLRNQILNDLKLIKSRLA